MSILCVYKVKQEVWDQIMYSDDAQNFYACNMQVYNGKSGAVRDKKQDLQIGKDTVCHMYRTRRGVTADNFFTCELADALFTKNMTVVGMLRKNKLEIPALFLSGKPRCVHSSIFGFTNNLTLVSHVPARNKSVILIAS